ncbi:MAG: acetyltransferase [Chloroflexi bacterium]|nr:acetyltransferase [Chloroflexota bacterium]
MTPHPVVIYGAGGHAKVVIDILEISGQHHILGLVDDDPAKAGTTYCGHRVLGNMRTLLDWKGEPISLILAIGDNNVRSRLAARLSSFPFVAAVHPTATLARGVHIGEGTVVMAHVVMNPGSSAGHHAIINTGAIVDHDCVIGDFAHLSPGVYLGGHVQVGQRTHIGIGASVVNDMTIGPGSIIGAGAAVVENIPPGVVAVGVPARVLRSVDKA